MPKAETCWAEGVSPCSGPISGDHYVSAGLFPGSMATVVGLRGDTPVSVAVDRLVSRCLCKGHNEALSPVDQAAIDIANAIRRLNLLRDDFETTRRAYPHIRIAPPTPTRFVTSGILFTRWAIKAAAGYAHVQHRQTEGWRPDLALARIAFGQASFAPQYGLALLARPGDRWHQGDHWSLALGRRNTPEPVALHLGFMGWRFLLTWSVPFSQLEELHFEGATERGDAIIPRPARVNFEPTNSLALELSWRDDYVPAQKLIALRRQRAR